MFQRSHHVSIGQTSLHLSENITLLAVFRSYSSVISKETEIAPDVRGVSFTHRLYNVGGRMNPCSAPACIFFDLDISPFGRKSQFSVKGKDLSIIRLIENFNSDDFYNKPMCNVVAKAFQ
jgi:hypothetical protein